MGKSTGKLNSIYYVSRSGTYFTFFHHSPLGKMDPKQIPVILIQNYPSSLHHYNHYFAVVTGGPRARGCTPFLKKNSKIDHLVLGEYSKASQKMWHLHETVLVCT